MIRYEILLPLRYNDGSPVEGEKFTETRLELLERFQAVSFESSAILGLWIHLGQVYEDELARAFVDADESPETKAFFRSYKQTLFRPWVSGTNGHSYKVRDERSVGYGCAALQ